MPKTTINYSKTIIYKLCCKDPTITEIYVGHTTNFSKRKGQHRSSCMIENDNKKYNYFVYKFIRENGGWNNWNMIVIEEFSCENKRQAEIRERYWIEELKASLNKVLPSRTDQEWRIINKNNKKKYDIEYRKNNNEEIRKKDRERYRNNKIKNLASTIITRFFIRFFKK